MILNQRDLMQPLTVSVLLQMIFTEQKTAEAQIQEEEYNRYKMV